MSNTTTITGGRLLVDCLITQGCDRVFTVPGESFLAVLDALLDSDIALAEERLIGHFAESLSVVEERAALVIARMLDRRAT